jgi:GWxTD domain-containing protein
MTNKMDKKTISATGATLLIVLGLASCGISMMPTKDVWFTQHYIIMQDFERDAYRTLSEPGKMAFQDLFWKYRSPDSKAAFAARLDYVTKNYWKENSRQPWNTDRSRIFLLHGSPAAIDYDQNVSWAMTVLPGGSGAVASDRSAEDLQANRAEIWTYQFDKYLIKYGFVFVVGSSSWKAAMPPTAGNQYRGEFEDYSRKVVFAVTDLAGYKQEIAGLEKKK